MKGVFLQMPHNQKVPPEVKKLNLSRNIFLEKSVRWKHNNKVECAQKHIFEMGHQPIKLTVHRRSYLKKKTMCIPQD